MRLANLLSTSTFRLALIYLALFAASAIALLGYVYWNTAGFLVRQTDEAVEAEIGGLAEQYRQGGLPALVHTVIQRSQDPRQSLYLVLDGQGNQLAGNLYAKPDVPPGPDGWMDFIYVRVTTEGVERNLARARAFRLPDGFYLIVGRDVQERREIETLITSSLIWAIGLTIALGLAGGLVISRNMLARVDAINRTADDIMHGDFSRRIPVAGVGDELDQLAGNLNAMLEQIESLMVGMRQVTDNIAHDLRSPLSRMRNRLEVTLMHEPPREEYRQVLEKTIKEADHLLGTFNALLSIARVEAGSPREQMADVDLSAVVRDAAELYQPVAEEIGIACTVDIEEGLRLRGNRNLLSQAVANLIDNAIKHARPTELSGHVADRLTIQAMRQGAQIRIAVADNGPGIPPADRERVFGRFVRLETSRHTPGSGLGLSLVTAVARLHGGRVEMQDNEPGVRAVLIFPTISRSPVRPPGITRINSDAARD